MRVRAAAEAALSALPDPFTTGAFIAEVHPLTAQGALGDCVRRGEVRRVRRGRYERGAPR